MEGTRRTDRRRTALRLWQWRLWAAGLFGARYDGLRHFAVVDPGVLMRCGQPRVRDLEEILRRFGLRTIVCARGGTRHPLRGRWFAKERAFAAARGIRFEHLPFSDAGPAPPAVIERFLDIVSDASSRPVLVHCEQGFHRTGVLCAAYRVAVMGWPLERALREMARHGFEADDPRRAGLLEALRDLPGAARSA